MKIRITEEDIFRGCRRDLQLCPLALALKRQLKETEVRVSTQAISIDDCRYWLTPKLTAFIQRFDAGVPVEPLEFEFYDLKPWKANEYYEYPEY